MSDKNKLSIRVKVDRSELLKGYLGDEPCPDKHISTNNWKMCIDIKDRNKECTKVLYPLPRINQHHYN